MSNRRIAILTSGALGLLVLVSAVAGANTPDGSEANIRNAWTGFPEGAWIAFDWSEQWGTNPATVEPRRTVVTGHRAIGTSLTETQVQKAGAWERVMGGLHGAYPPDGEGMALVSETPEQIEVAGRSVSCVRREYTHDEADGSGQRLVLWDCKGTALVPRVLPQWSISFGWQLAPGVARALIERRYATGAVNSVELVLDATGESLDIGGRSITSFREKLYWRHRLAGQQEGKITRETIRWMSADVPGLVVKQVDDNQMGKVARFQVRSFGTTSE